MGDPLLQACVDEFGIAAIYLTREPVRIGTTTKIGKLNRLDPAAIWWLPAAQAAGLVATARPRLKNVAGESLASATFTATAREGGITLTADADFKQRAGNLIALVNEKFERMRKSGELRKINASYAEARARGDRVPPYSTFVLQYKRYIFSLATQASNYNAEQKSELANNQK